MATRPTFNFPLPKTDHLSRQFYENCGAGVLAFQRCSSCNSWRHIPREYCSACQSPEWRWAPSTGKGKLFSWTVTESPPVPQLSGVVPYVSAIVEMEEGVRIVTVLHQVEPDELEIDLPLRVLFMPVGDDIAIPLFTR